MLTDDITYLECDCRSPEHILRYTIYYDSNEKPLYPPTLVTEVQLRQYRCFLKRIVVAIKYVFGYTCKYGHWDCFDTESLEEAEKLKQVCEQFIDLYQDYKERENAPL